MPALELLRHLAQRLDIFCDVLAVGAVAACGSDDQRATFVAQRHREPIDFRLGAEGYCLFRVQLKKAADADNELDYVVRGKSIREREHRHCVPNFFKS